MYVLSHLIGRHMTCLLSSSGVNTIHALQYLDIYVFFGGNLLYIVIRHGSWALYYFRDSCAKALTKIYNHPKTEVIFSIKRLDLSSYLSYYAYYLVAHSIINICNQVLSSMNIYSINTQASVHINCYICIYTNKKPPREQYPHMDCSKIKSDQR